MQAIGDDRIHLRPDGCIVLICVHSKNWYATTTEKSSAGTAHPGTAVLAAEECWEVVEASESSSRFRYVLRPWLDENVMRDVSRYDEEAEAERELQWNTRIATEGRRTSVVAFAFLVGLLPASIQRSIESETGVRPAKMTLLSTIAPIVFGCFAISRIPIPGIRVANESVSPAVFAIGLYFVLESAFRILSVLCGEPMGSILGKLYSIVFLRRTRETPPHDAEAPAEEAERSLVDLFTTLEPVLSFLPVTEQQVLVRHYDFDPSAHTRRTALLLLLFGAVGTAASLRGGVTRISEALSVLCGGYLVIEQIVRLLRARRNLIAPSILGVLVRPLSRRLFRLQ